MNQGNRTTRTQYWEDDPPEEKAASCAEEPTAPRSRRPKEDARATNEGGEEEALASEEGRGLPRLRQKIQRVERHSEKPSGQWWRPASSFGRALLALGVLAVLGAVTVPALLLRNELEHDNRFRIAGTASIEADGLTQVARTEILPVFGEDIGKNIFFVHLDQRRRDLEAIPWVKHARVMRVLPNRIRVTLEERVPVAFTQINGETGLVDADGVLLTMPAATMAARHYSFPEVTGLEQVASQGERRVRMMVYMRMMAELDANGQHNTQQISEVDLSDPEDARVKMADQGGDIVAHLGYEHFLDRYRRYMRHIGEWRQQQPRLIGVDLRYERQAVLQMQPLGVPMPGEVSAAEAAAQTTAEQTAQTPATVDAQKPAETAKTAPAKTAQVKAVPAKIAPVKKSAAKPEAALAKKDAERTGAAKAAAKSVAAAHGKSVEKPAKGKDRTEKKSATRESGGSRPGGATLRASTRAKEPAAGHARTAKPGAAQPSPREAVHGTPQHAVQHKPTPVVLRPVSQAVEGQ